MAIGITHLPPGHEPGPQSSRGASLGPLKRALSAPFRRELHGISLQVEPIETVRGGTVRVVLTLEAGADDGTQLQVGLVCTQYTDVKKETVDSNGGTSSSRVIERTDVVADWHDVPSGMSSQNFEFTVPPDGPFSYEGATVSWAYRVSARRPRHHAVDPEHDFWIWVRP